MLANMGPDLLFNIFEHLEVQAVHHLVQVLALYSFKHALVWHADHGIRLNTKDAACGIIDQQDPATGIKGYDAALDVAHDIVEVRVCMLKGLFSIADLFYHLVERPYEHADLILALCIHFHIEVSCCHLLCGLGQSLYRICHPRCDAYCHPERGENYYKREKSQ